MSFNRTCTIPQLHVVTPYAHQGVPQLELQKSTHSSGLAPPTRRGKLSSKESSLGKMISRLLLLRTKRLAMGSRSLSRDLFQGLFTSVSP